jgi:hypothetical protein
MSQAVIPSAARNLLFSLVSEGHSFPAANSPPAAPPPLEKPRQPAIARRRIEIFPDRFRFDGHESHARRVPVAYLAGRLGHLEFPPQLRRKNHRMPGPFSPPRHHDLFPGPPIGVSASQPVDHASPDQRVVHGIDEKRRIARNESQPSEQGTELPAGSPAPIHHHACPARHRRPNPFRRIAQNNDRWPQPAAILHGNLNRSPPPEQRQRLRKSQLLRPPSPQKNRHNLFLLQSASRRNRGLDGRHRRRSAPTCRDAPFIPPREEFCTPPLALPTRANASVAPASRRRFSPGSRPRNHASRASLQWTNENRNA